MRITPQKLLTCAVNTARRTATHALSQCSRRGDVGRELPHDIKLKLDIECQAKARKLIGAAFPRHRFLGEEDETSTVVPLPDFSFAKDAGPLDAPDQDFLWIVDPLDGTVNFNHGLPLWCCSVAVAVRGKIVAGAVYSPVLDRCYAACAGGCATCNGRIIRVSSRRRLADSIILTGLDRCLGSKVGQFALFNAIAAKVQRARTLGSAALDLCFVAEGAAEGYMEAGIYIWDIAAGGLIVRQAGGRTEQLAKLPANRLCFLATNGIVHPSMKAIVQPVLEIATGPIVRRKR